MKTLFTILLLLIFNSQLFSQGTIYFVKEDGNDSNAGTSWATAFATVQKALDSADSLDQIWVAEGTYHPTSDYGVGDGNDKYKHFRLKNGVSLYGGFIGNEIDLNQRDYKENETILSGAYGEGWSDRVNYIFYHPKGIDLDSTALLDGFLIADGRSGGSHGGGMYNEESHPTIRNSMFTNNRGDDGAAIYNKKSNPVIDNCEFNNNQTEDMGGGRGGGIYNHYSNPIIKISIFYRNEVGLGYGGGVYNYYSDPYIETCAFIENDASGGFGRWEWAVSTHPSDVGGKIREYT